MRSKLPIKRLVRKAIMTQKPDYPAIALAAAIVGVPAVLIVALFLKYNGPQDPIHQVYERCQKQIPDFAMTDSTLAKQAQNRCLQEQQAAYLARDIDKREAAARAEKQPS